MLVLAFTTCLLATPAECQERQLTFIGPATPFHCMHYGQAALAEWEASHPKYRIVGKWKCGPADQIGKGA